MREYREVRAINLSKMFYLSFFLQLVKVFFNLFPSSKNNLNQDSTFKFIYNK